MALEVAPLVTFVSGTVGAVGAVGAASLGLRAVLQTFKILREEMGMGVKEASIEAKHIVALQNDMAARNAMTPEQRQADKQRQLELMNTPEFREMGKQLEADQLDQITDNPEWRDEMREREASDYAAFGRNGHPITHKSPMRSNKRFSIT